MKFNISLSVLLFVLMLSCKNENKENINVEKDVTTTSLSFQNLGHELVYKMVQKVGDYKQLRAKKDVTYTYTYETPDGKTDVSTEKYIFNGELSYGAYKVHQRTLPNLEGLIEQGYDGENYWLKHNEVYITNEDYLRQVRFNRPTNFYWFTMFQKLLDPGLNYEFLGEQKIENTIYSVVKVSFTSNDDKPTDIYQLYINNETLLVDQFLFTVADFGKMETPFLMKLLYEKVDDLLIPTKRLYKTSTWDAIVTNDPWIKVTWSAIKFNTNISKDVFSKTN